MFSIIDLSYQNFNKFEGRKFKIISYEYFGK